MPETAFIMFTSILLLCCAMCLYRIARGPTAPDRSVGIDILGTVVVGFCSLLTLSTGKDYIMNVAMVWALISFIGTLALAKHLELSSRKRAPLLPSESTGGPEDSLKGQHDNE